MSKHLSAASAHRIIASIYATVYVAIAVIVLLASEGKGWQILLVLAPISAILIGMHLLIAKGAEKCSSWARIASITVGAFLLIGFPIGTVLGIWLLANSLGDWIPAKRISISNIDGWPDTNHESA